jgi:hypothetical protein
MAGLDLPPSSPPQVAEQWGGVGGWRVLDLLGNSILDTCLAGLHTTLADLFLIGGFASVLAGLRKKSSLGIYSS